MKGIVPREEGKKRKMKKKKKKKEKKESDAVQVGNGNQRLSVCVAVKKASDGTFRFCSCVGHFFAGYFCLFLLSFSIWISMGKGDAI